MRIRDHSTTAALPEGRVSRPQRGLTVTAHPVVPRTEGGTVRVGVKFEQHGWRQMPKFLLALMAAGVARLIVALAYIVLYLSTSRLVDLHRIAHAQISDLQLSPGPTTLPAASM